MALLDVSLCLSIGQQKYQGILSQLCDMRFLLQMSLRWLVILMCGVAIQFLPIRQIVVSPSVLQICMHVKRVVEKMLIHVLGQVHGEEREEHLIIWVVTMTHQWRVVMVSMMAPMQHEVSMRKILGDLYQVSVSVSIVSLWVLLLLVQLQRCIVLVQIHMRIHLSIIQVHSQLNTMETVSL